MARITEDHLEQQALDQVILFQAADGQVTLDVRLEAVTGWFSQAPDATHHVGNMFRDGELPAPDPGRTKHSRAIPINWLATGWQLVGNWLATGWQLVDAPHAPRHAIRRRV